MNLHTEDELTNWLKNEVSNKSDAHYRKKGLQNKTFTIFCEKKAFLWKTFSLYYP